MTCKVINSSIYLTTNDEEIEVNNWVYVDYPHSPNQVLQVEEKVQAYGVTMINCKGSIYQYHPSRCTKVIASTEDLEGVLQIPQEFIQLCLDNDEIYVGDSGFGTLVILPVEKVQENTISQYLIDGSTLVKVNGVEHNVNYLTFCNLRLAQKKGEITLEYYHKPLNKWFVIDWYNTTTDYKTSTVAMLHSAILDQMID